MFAPWFEEAKENEEKKPLTCNCLVLLCATLFIFIILGFMAFGLCASRQDLCMGGKSKVSPTTPTYLYQNLDDRETPAEKRYEPKPGGIRKSLSDPMSEGSSENSKIAETTF